MRSERRLNVSLIWHGFGHNNLGVDALSRANAAIIQAAARKKGLQVAFITLGTGQKPDVPELPTNVSIGANPSLRELLLGRSRFLRTLRDSDLAVDIGEGDSFSDIYGRQRFAFFCATKLASILLGRPLILAPQTIGPFDRPLHRRLAKFILDRASAVFTRDYLSTAFLNEMGVRAPRDEFIDVAFRLPYEPASPSSDRVRVGVNVSGLLYNSGYSGKNELGMALDYAELTRQLLGALSRRADIDIALFAHVAGDGGADDDGPAIEALGRQFPSVRVIPRFATSIAAKSWMSGLDFVVAGRMHACIGAYSAGAPVVPVAYSRKFNGLFGTLNYPYFVDGKASTTEKALGDILSWFDGRAELKARLEASRPIIDERLQRYEDRMGEILQAVARQAARP